MNLADSERMAGVLDTAGYRCTENASDADVLIYNTCSIRDKAEQKVYSALGRQVLCSSTLTEQLDLSLLFNTGSCLRDKDYCEIGQQNLGEKVSDLSS